MDNLEKKVDYDDIYKHKEKNSILTGDNSQFIPMRKINIMIPSIYI